MNMIWLCITSLLLITTTICDQKIDRSHIRVFPAANKTVAGVFQATHLNYLNQPQYAFNASEARQLCLSLGVDIASKAQVNVALSRGLETCRFGWIDEHLAVIPRREAVSNCGKNQTGLVTWRASVTKQFDVFCYNESDAAKQLKDTPTDSPLKSMDFSRQTQSYFQAANSNQNTHSTPSSTLLPSSPSTPRNMDIEAEPERFVGHAQGSAGAKAIIITSTCALVLIAVIIFAYIKMRRSRALSSDIKQKQDYIQTEQWTCVKNVKETKIAVQDDDTNEVDSNSS